MLFKKKKCVYMSYKKNLCVYMSYKKKICVSMSFNIKRHIYTSVISWCNTLTSNQLGTKPCTQTHDAIYSLISTIQYSKYTLQKPTYVAFVDYSTAYPSVHRDRLSSILLNKGIVGHMWHYLRARIDNIRLRVLHPNIQDYPWTPKQITPRCY